MILDSQEFKAAVEEAWHRKGFKSLRQAEEKTGIEHTSILRMRQGVVPSRARIVEWATAIGDEPNKWLMIAGYEPIDIPQKQIPHDPPAAPARSAPEIPRELHTAISTADTREKKIDIAWSYIWLRGDEFGFKNAGSADMKANHTEAKLAIIRLVERSSGVRLLPPDVV